jgi:hypothetical protein
VLGRARAPLAATGERISRPRLGPRGRSRALLDAAGDGAWVVLRETRAAGARWHGGLRDRVFLVNWRSMKENVGHNWRGALDDEYNRLVNLSAMAMIAASRKPDFSKQSAFYAKQAPTRRRNR